MRSLIPIVAAILTLAAVTAGPARAATAPVISISFSADVVELDDAVGLQFSITNPDDTDPLTGVTFADPLPPGLVVASPADVATDCGGIVTADPGDASIALTGGAIDPASTCVATVQLRVTTLGPHDNTTGPPSATETGAGAISNTATVTAIASPTIAKTFDVANIPLDGTGSLTYDIDNPNAATGFGNLELADILPAGLIVGAGGANGTCGGGTIFADPGSSTVQLFGGDVDPAGGCSFSVDVDGTSAGTKTIASSPLTYTFDDGIGTVGGAVDAATAALLVIAPPMLSAEFAAATAGPGSITAIDFTITNPNASIALTGVDVADTLPAGVTIAAPSGLTGTCGGATITATSGAGVITLSGGSIAASGECSFSVDVVSATEGAKVNLTGAPSSTEGGIGTPATDTLFVADPFTAQAAFADASVVEGAGTTLTITLANPNVITTLTGAAFAFTLPSGLTIAEPVAVTSTCAGAVTASAQGATVALSGGSVAPGDQCTVTLAVLTTAAGKKTLSTGPVTSVQGGDGPSASASLDVSARPLVSTNPAPPAAKQVPPAPVARIDLHGPSPQSVTDKRDVPIIVGCGPLACTVSATGSLKLPGSTRRYRLTSETTTIAASSYGRVRLPTSKALRSAIRRAFRRHPGRPMSILVTVTAKTTAGTVAASQTIRVRRPGAGASTLAAADQQLSRMAHDDERVRCGWRDQSPL